MKTPRDKIIEVLDRFFPRKEVVEYIADEVLKIVVGEIENEMPNAWFPNSALHLKKRYMEDIITSLTQGTTSTKKEE
jgi:hypothetical protein